MIYYGYLICKKCNAHMDWGTKKCCPNCGCGEGVKDE